MTSKIEKNLTCVPDNLQLKRLLRQLIVGEVDEATVFFTTEEKEELDVCIDRNNGFNGGSKPPISEGKNGIWSIRGKLRNLAGAPVFIMCEPRSRDTIKGHAFILVGS